MSLGIVKILRIPEGFLPMTSGDWNTSFRVTPTFSGFKYIFGEIYMYVNRIRTIRECS